MKKIAFVFCCFCLLVTATVTNTFAQGTTSRVTGVVQDKNGAAIPGATVTLTNDANGTALTTTTSDSGVYTFDLIQVGSYSIMIEKQGFKKYLSNHNHSKFNQPL